MLCAHRPLVLRQGAGTGDVVFWEDADTFVARVVDSRQSGDRLARCDMPLGTCVLVES